MGNTGSGSGTGSGTGPGPGSPRIDQVAAYRGVNRAFPPLWISFFTDDYARDAGRLIGSLDRFGLEREVLRVEDAGTWQANCERKAKFVWERIAANPGRPIIWTDADSAILRYPTLLMGPPKADIALCRFRRPEGRLETLSGTVYFAPTPGAARVVDRWIELTMIHPGIWDQRVLEWAVEACPDVKVELLPVEFVFIHDTFRQLFPDAEPVIEHYQASRGTRGKRVFPQKAGGGV